MMTETTQIIIATLSGFIIAFFAEPVKNYFANRSKLRNLKIALYKELCNNYSTLNSNTRLDLVPTMLFYQSALRTECYEHALEHEISLFYQLDEASMINSLQGDAIRAIQSLSKYVLSLPNEEYKERQASLTEQFQNLTGIYLTVFNRASNEGGLDGNLINKLYPRNHLKIVVHDVKPQI